MVFRNKKSRIYAVCGVSQTPRKLKILERSIDTIQVSEKMKEQIREIYAHQIQKEGKGAVSLWEQETVLEAIRDLSGRIPEGEYEKLRDKVFTAASIGEEAGFVMGFIYAVRLFTECL